MGKVDTDNGFTRIANELMEVIPKAGLNGTQHNILWVVFRYTYGFHRKEHELSLTFIAEATESHKVVIQREIKKLIDMKLLIEKSPPTFNSSRVIAFNKDYTSWELTKQLTVNQKDNHTVNQSVNSTVNHLVNQERKKDNLKESRAFFEQVWKKYPNKKGKGNISDSKKKELFKLGDEFMRCIDRYIQYVEEQRRNGFPELKYQYGSSFFNSGYVDYLDENYQPKEQQPKRWTIGSDRLL